MHSIDVTLRVAIANGPEIRETSNQSVEAYGEIVFEITAGETKKVEVQPSAKEDIVFLFIKSSKYTFESAGGTSEVLISYYVADPTPTTTDPPTPAGTAIMLDQPHLYNGPGGVAILAAAPKDLWFKNNAEEENTAEIEILIGRKAVKTDT